jgi:hypothetical protein
MSPSGDRPETPECDKMLAIAEQSQRIGEFLDWLPTIGVRLCDRNGDFYPQGLSTQSLLALFFEIDLNKVEQEKRALLEWMRETNGGKP